MKLQMRLAESKGLKSSGAMLAYVALGSVAALAVLFWTLVWPPIKEYNDLMKHNEQLQQQIASLFNRPQGAKVSQEDLLRLARQIPTSEEISQFVLALREKERIAGVTILTIDNQVSADYPGTANAPAIPTVPSKPGSASVEPKFDESGNSISVDPAIGSYKSTTPGSSGQATQPGGAGQQSGTNAGKQGASPALTMLNETKLQLSVSGGYEQIVRFVAELQRMERFVNVTEWSMSTAPGASEAPAGAHEKLSMQIRLSIYAAEAFAGKWPVPEEAPVPAGSNRTDPTLTQDALLQQLSPIQ